MRVIRDSSRILAHWVYSPDEWKLFRQWERRRQGWLRYLFGSLIFSAGSKLPEVTITGSRIKINEQAEVFLDQFRRLKRVHIRESGPLNIFEIYYQQANGRLRSIYLPIPRGRLREAMELQESLSGYTA